MSERRNINNDREKFRRAEESEYFVELVGILSAEMGTDDGCTKANILNRTFDEINSIHSANKRYQAPDSHQDASVSSSAPSSMLSHDSVISPWILDALNGFLFVVDQGGKIEYITRNVTAFLRYNEQELRGKPIENIIHVGDRSNFNSKLIALKRASTSGCSTNASGNGGSDISSSSGSFSSTSCSNEISPSMLIAGTKSFGEFSTSGSGKNKTLIMNARLLINPRASSYDNDNNDVINEEDDDNSDSDSPFVLSSLTKNSSTRKSKCENSGASTSNKSVSGGPLVKFSDADAGRLSEPRYANLQLSISLLQSPSSDRLSLSPSGNDFVVFCMARRIPESSLSEPVELFSTKLDINGKILSIDTSDVSSTYSQYLNRDLINKCILDLCHPDDRKSLECHLKNVREGKVDLTSQYKFQVTKDKYLIVQTRSNRWDSGDDVFITSLHSIITREDETASINSCQQQSFQPQKQLQQVCTVTGISNLLQDNSIVVESPASSFNRDVTKSMTTSISVPFQPLTPISPSSNIGSSDFPINDCLGLSKMFPSMSDFDSNPDTGEGGPSSNITMTGVRSNDLTSTSQNSQASLNVSSLISHPSFAPSVSSSGSNHLSSVKRNSPIPVVTPSSSTSSLKMGNSFSNEFLAQGTSDQSNSSGTQNQNQNQQQTQQSQSGQSSQSQQSSINSLSQPSQGSGQGSLGIGVGSGSGSGSGQQPQQPPSSSSSRQPSPAPGSVPIQQLQMPSPEQTAATPQAIQSPSGPASTQKLRNLLTQGLEADSPGNSDINQSNSGSNDLLRELLNADEDEEISGSSGANRSSSVHHGGNSSSNMMAGTSSAATTSSNQPTTPFGGNTSNVFFKTNALGLLDNSNNNNMLRKLLNDDDSKSYRRNQELMAHLWKEEGQSSSSNQSSGVPTSLSELMSPSPGSAHPSSRLSGGSESAKRKSIDEHQFENETISGSQSPTPGNFGAVSTNKRPAIGGLSPGPQYNQTGKSPLTGLSGGTVASSSQGIGSVISSASSSVSGVGLGVSSSIGSTTTAIAATGGTCGSTSGVVVSSGQSSGQPAQLAIQNPMLTSMLAQTPKTLPATPMSIPTSIVSQVPQERLPKNLEKKLIHTPANQMIGITSLATSISSPIVVSSHVSSGGPQGIVSISNAPISSSSHVTIKPRQPAPSLLPLQQQQQQHQTQQPQPQPPQQQQLHLPQTSQQAQAFVVSNSGHQNFRTLHSQTQVQIVQTPSRYPVFPDNRATAQQIQQITNVQPGLHHQQIPNLGGQPTASGQIKATLSGSTQSQQSLPQVSPQSSNIQSHVAFIDSISSTTSSSANSSSNLASSSLLAAPQDPQDPLLSEILDQVWSLQQEMNIESTQGTITATAHSTTDDMLNMMFEEALDPSPSSNVAVPTAINLPIVSGGITGPGLASSPPDLNEMKAISEIQRQLMSCESSPSQPQGHPGTMPASSRPQVFAHRTGPLPSPSLQQQPNFSNSPAFQSPLCPPPAYGVTSVPTATQGSVHGVAGPPQASQQLILQQSGVSGGPGMRRFPGPPHPNGNLQFPTQIIQHRASEHHQFNVTPGVVGPPLQLQPRGKGPIDSKKQRLFQNQQEYEVQRLLAQQTQQEYTLNTPQTDNIEMPPNVALHNKARMGPMTPEAGQLSPRYPILNVGASPGGVQAQSSLPQSPAGGGNGPPSSSVSTSLQSTFTSPSTGGPSSTYGHSVPQPSHRMSPHPYSNVPSPAGGRGPNSPATHLQLASPQPSSTSSPVSAPHGWPPPVSTSNVPVAGSVGPNSIRTLGPTGLPSNRIQQQNPMLNAQLSQGTFTTATAQPNIRCNPQPSPATQRLCNSRGSMASPSPGPLHSASRNSPIPQYPSSPGLYQSDRQTPGSCVGSLTSPATSSAIGQPRMLNQPSRNQQQQQQVPPRPQMMTARVNSPRFANRGGVVSDDGNGGPGSSMGSPYNYPQPSTPIMDSNNPSGLTPNQFIFDNRSVSGVQTSTSNASTVSSDFVRQELRAMVGARSQQAQIQQQQQLPQQQAQQPQSHQQQPNQHLHQSSSMTPSSSQSTSSNMLGVSSSNNSFTAAELEQFGFSFDCSDLGVVTSGTSVTSNCGPGSPLFSNMFDSGSQVSSPLTSSSSTAQGSMTFGSSDNNSGSDQKRSLLQELLSSPP